MSDGPPPAEGEFSNDPLENLRIENEILSMRVKAELGGAYEGSEDLPPEIENEFLKSILNFEHAYAQTKRVKISALIGNPILDKADELDDQAIKKALAHVEQLLDDQHIEVVFNKPRSARFKYSFITEELLDQETDDLFMEGMTRQFTYEEFHPDHKAEITDQTLAFLADWFDRKTDEANGYLAEQFIQPDGKVFPRQALLDMLNHVFDAYTDFEECQYAMGEVKYEMEPGEGEERGMGFSEGILKYIAILENGERKPVEGPFKFYFSREESSWKLFFFYLTGFNS
jgi:hypothetical protein